MVVDADQLTHLMHALVARDFHDRNTRVGFVQHVHEPRHQVGTFQLGQGVRTALGHGRPGVAQAPQQDVGVVTLPADLEGGDGGRADLVFLTEDRQLSERPCGLDMRGRGEILHQAQAQSRRFRSQHLHQGRDPRQQDVFLLGPVYRRNLPILLGTRRRVLLPEALRGRSLLRNHHGDSHEGRGLDRRR